MIVGNGDINALVHSRGSRVIISLTKNDVWDARLLTENDPPLPTMKRLKELVAAGWPANGNKEWILPGATNYDGNDSYHANPFPCPLQCAEVVLNCSVAGSSSQREAGFVEMIRAQGSLNEFAREGATGIMRIKGNAEASNGFRYELNALSGARVFPQIDVTLRGTSNTAFCGYHGYEQRNMLQQRLAANTPRKARTFTYDLPGDKTFSSIILYTWTEDGALAENVFERVVFKGKDNENEIPLGAVPGAPMPSRLSLEKAVAAIDPVPEKTHSAMVRACLARRMFSSSRPTRQHSCAP